MQGGRAVSAPRGGGRAGTLALLLGTGAACLALGVMTLRDWRATRAAHPRTEGALRVEGPKQPVVLHRDRRGVPHVEAQSESDAYFGLGFAHAQDRPSQMVWLVRTARGRLAELAGEAALPADRRARLLGIGRHADAAFERMPRRSRALLAAYAAGVNAQLGRLGGPDAGMPRGLARWGAPIEAWQPADSVAIVKLLAWGLGGALDESLVLSDVIERVGGAEARLFFPRGVGGAAVPEGAGLPVEARHALPPPPVGAGFGRPRFLPAAAPLRRQVGLWGASAGSTAWLVGGRHSRSGGALIASDAHFAPTLPAAYYEAHLRGGALDVAGATLPGVPVFWSGFNPRVAWASTHAAAVVTDLYVESLHPRDAGRYHDGRRWRSLASRTEEIRVRGGETEPFVVRETRHGPLVNPILDREREPLALRWTGAERGGGLHAMLDVARAENALALRRALSAHHEPVLAFVYADREGEAGLQVAGFVPRRRQPASLLPAPGRDPAYGWEGRLPPESLPARALEEGRGFLVAADAVLESEGSAPLEWLWRPGARASRAERVLGRALRRGGLDLRDLAALQLDSVSETGGSLVEAALAMADAAGGRHDDAAAILRDWDHRTTPDSVGAAVYHLFLDRLLRELFAERLGAELLDRYLALGRASHAELALRVVSGEAGPGPWASRAWVRDAVQRSLRDVGYRLPVELGANRNKWAWGRLHALRFRPLWPGGPDALGPFAYGGDASSLLATDYRPLHSFAPQVAPIYRLLVDTAALDEALTLLAPGQSEHPGHPHQADALPRWLAGRAGLLATSPLAVEDGAVASLRLEPGP